MTVPAGSRDYETTLIEVKCSDFEWMLYGEPTGNRGLMLSPGGVDDPSVLRIVRSITRGLHEAGCRASWMVVSEGEVVGLCSYRRVPSNGCVEIGYGIAESRRGRGHATRAVAAMVRIAKHDSEVKTLIAETSTGNPASARVLEKNGFEQTGTRLDPEDGKVAMWQLGLRQYGCSAETCD